MNTRFIRLIVCMLMMSVCIFGIQGFCADDYDYTGKYSEGMAAVGRYIDGEMKYGYINESGEVMVDFLYDLAWDFSDSLAKVTADGATYFIDKNGEVVLDTSLYDIVGSFADGVAVFCPVDIEPALWGLLDKSGNIVAEAKYSAVLPQSEGVYAACYMGKWGFIDNGGNVVVDFIYDDAESFAGGLGAVKKDGKWGFIDKDGNVYIEFIFDAAQNFAGDVSVVNKNGKWGILHKDRIFVVNPQYEHILRLENGMYRVKDENGKFGCMDEDYNMAVDCSYDMIFPSDTSYIKVMKKAGENSFSYGYIDKLGQRILPVIYEQADEIKDGRVRVVLNGKTGYVDLKNQPVIAPVYGELTAIDADRFLAEKNGLYGVVGQDGEVLIELKYENRLEFGKNGLAAACLEGKWGFIDKTGTAAIDFSYDELGNFDESGYAIAKKGELYGIINEKNEKTASFSYKYLEKADDDLYLAVYGSKFGYINESGEVLVDFVYDDITLFDDGVAAAEKDGSWWLVLHPLKEDNQPVSQFYYYNTPLEFENAPLNEQSGYMYPLRELCDYLGIEIVWDAQSQTVGVNKYDFTYSPEGDIVSNLQSFNLDLKSGKLYENGIAVADGTCVEKDGVTYITESAAEQIFNMSISFDYFTNAYVFTLN